ncbi:hypothetical protein B0H66DRAFT_622704 [Apodospora peruviana]|uniref:Uncharacterized protein n=1 Tax=Apodospora peruviana TaxID=516989 RepID=A0AAE0I5P2_9PEZI|nr:hypothetical protein B0H66DRAFT_622704 [Apodospora peruviana]
MSSAQAEPIQFQGFFATAPPRERPLRTYSLKGKSGRVGLLPHLKPKVSPVRPARKQAADWSPFRSGRDISAANVPKLPPDNFDVRARRSHSNLSSLVDTDEDNGDDDESLSTAKTSLESVSRGSAGRTTTRTSNQPTRIRRKPFLIFNKTIAKRTSYKKLVPKADTTKLSHRPGDGFSDREARPDSLFHLPTKRGRPSRLNSVRTLDLTQTPPSSPSVQAKQPPKQPKKPERKKRRVQDNSFLPDSPRKKKKATPDHRRRDEEKNRSKNDPRLSVLSAPCGAAASAILGEPVCNGMEAGALPQSKENQDTPGKNVAPEETRPIGISPISADEQGGIGVVCMEFSDRPLLGSDRIRSSGLDRNYISDTPPLRERAKSESFLQPHARRGKEMIIGATVQTWQRKFRRVNTT